MQQKATMTSSQRVEVSLNWQEPDRVPIQTYLTPEVEQRLKSHFGGRDILECLGVDFREVQPRYLRVPGCEGCGLGGEVDSFGSG